MNTEELRYSSTLASFKCQLKNLQNNSKVPHYYTVGNRYLSVLHARIRNNCSNLSSDLFMNHLSPNSMCRCSDESEDAEHFFYRFSNYNYNRVTLFQSTRNHHPLNIDILLFGDENLTNEDNINIFTTVQTFIKDIRRFVS